MWFNTTLVLLIISLMQLRAGVYAQRVNIDRQHISIENALGQINQQTGYDFMWLPENLKSDRKVTIQLKDATVETALQQLLKGLPLTYELNGKTIVIREKTILENMKDAFQSAVGSDTRWPGEKQEGTVSGRVLSEDGKPLAGATITASVQTSIPGVTRKTTITDREGRFTLYDVPAGAILIISYVGYQAKEIKADGNLSAILLTASTADLDEVVINKGYYTESKRLSTGSVGRVDAKTISQQPVTNVMGALIGRIPGLEVTQGGGMPGAPFKVRVRGQNSITAGNNPLFIVDGVPFSSESLGHNYTSGHLPYIDGVMALSPFNTLNPADIASIEVLKDADATAIYGSRGSNGVILITTKRGQAGKTQFDLRLNNSFSKAGQVMETVHTAEYLAIRREAYANNGITEYPSEAYDVNGTWSQDQYTNWIDALLGGTAKSLNVQGGVSGGSDRTQFLVRGGYQRETTVFQGDYHYDRGSVLANVNHRSADDRFTLNLSANYATDNNNMLTTDPTFTAIYLAPNAPNLYNSDGSLNWADGTWTNPLAVLESDYIGKTRNLTSNILLGYRLFDELELKASLGYSDFRLDEYMTNPSTMYNPIWNIGSEASYANSTIGNRQNWIVEPQVNWTKKIGQGTLQALAAATFQQQTSTRSGQQAYGFPSNALIYDLTAANDQYSYLSESVLYKYHAVFGRLNYNWQDKYMVNLTARRDGSSRFSPERQFANFGALGVAWILSNEPFVRQVLPFLSFAKLRGSYGLTGNDQIGDYQFLNTYATSGGDNYQNIVGLLSQRVYNPNFGWETNQKLETSVEAGVLDDRIYVTATWYRNRSDNQLVGIPLPGITGFNALQANLGAKVQNTGWELEIKATPVRSAAVTWRVSANMTIPRNKLLEFPDLATSTYANTYIVGQPLSISRRYHMTGIHPETGIYQYEDVNGDGQLSATYDRTVVKNIASLFFGGISNNLIWHNWQLDIFFQFVKKTGNNYLFGIPYPGAYIASITQYAADRIWRPGVTDADIQVLSAGGNQSAMNAWDRLYSSDVAVSDIYFIRLKNVSLTYQLPSRWLSGLSSQLFFQGQNLFTLTNFIGQDPEMESMQSLPPLKTFNLGIQLSF